MHEEAFNLLRNINPKISKGELKPHKYALLLAILDLYIKNNDLKNEFKINDELELLFAKYLKILDPNIIYYNGMIEYPFYHLHSDGIWILSLNKGKELEYNEIVNKNSRFTKKRIKEIFHHASLIEPIHNLFKNNELQEKIREFIINLYKEQINKNIIFKVNYVIQNKQVKNTIVAYLNSLQRIRGNNKNALAESQACDSIFPLIQEPHPLSTIIFEELKSQEKKHVILTGNAGDGKSTIALEVYKRLRGFSFSSPLDRPLREREEVGNITIIKDLSERDRNKDISLLEELQIGYRKFLLVSNTGTLLDFFKKQTTQLGEPETEIENELLQSISSECGEASLTLGNINFRIFNLGRMDNLKIARGIFEKMLAPERWEPCESCDSNPRCPVYLNVTILRCNQYRAVDRIFLAYRRMYEYGTRLTLRQLTEHLSYLITAGLEEEDIQDLLKKDAQGFPFSYLFYNRFFGDNGKNPDTPARSMAAIRAILSHRFGESLCPTWEHKLWSIKQQEIIKLGVPPLEDVFTQMRKLGARISVDKGISHDQAREQVRRMLFFCYDFGPTDTRFLSQYLNSPTLLSWEQWQDSTYVLDFSGNIFYQRKIYHVLQEHFTGVRLPELSEEGEQRLYVTLSRRREDVRQSAQIVLAQIDWGSSFELKLVETTWATGEKCRDLRLVGKDRFSGIDLPLRVPFLDYVMTRHYGELNETLLMSYQNLLDGYKAKVTQMAGSGENEGIMLVRLKLDNTFRRQVFSVKNGYLEVSDGY